MEAQKDSKSAVFVGDSIDNRQNNHPTNEGFDLIRSALIKSGAIPLEVEEVKSGKLPEHKPEDKTED